MIVVRVTRGRDAPDRLAVERPDGSSTWQDRPAGFGVAHDLTHLAVESVLGLGQGFFGLLASGWDISDFERKQVRDARGIPATSIWVEGVVMGIQSKTWGTGARDAETFNDGLLASLEANEIPDPRRLTQAELDAARSLSAELIQTFQSLRPGDARAWSFAPGAPGRPRAEP